MFNDSLMDSKKESSKKEKRQAVRLVSLSTQRDFKVEPNKELFSEHRQFKMPRNKALIFVFLLM